MAFLVMNALRVHPMALEHSDRLKDHADLLGRTGFALQEEDPMIGICGASRYTSPRYEAGFALECRAIQRLRRNMGFDTVIVMIPFCQSPFEAGSVLATLAKHGLKCGKDGLEVWVMGESPANVILAKDFAARFDSFSIGSNDLTQLALGVDRDSEDLASLCNGSDPAVLWMIETLITHAHQAGSKVGLCGQAPSNDPAFARLLVRAGIAPFSVTPDSFVAGQTQRGRRRTLRRLHTDPQNGLIAADYPSAHIPRAGSGFGHRFRKPADGVGWASCPPPLFRQDQLARPRDPQAVDLPVKHDPRQRSTFRQRPGIMHRGCIRRQPRLDQRVHFPASSRAISASSTGPGNSPFVAIRIRSRKSAPRAASRSRMVNSID